MINTFFPLSLFQQHTHIITISDKYVNQREHFVSAFLTHQTLKLNKEKTVFEQVVYYKFNLFKQKPNSFD